MKIVFLTVFVLAAVAVGATPVLAPDTLPPSVFADTEAVTNVACASWVDNQRIFEVSLTLAATSSNCVTVAFGRDLDADGILSVSETAFELGWDCGQWIVRSGPGVPAGTAGLGAQGFAQLTTSSVTEMGRKTFVWRGAVRQRHHAGAAVTENGQPLFTDVAWRDRTWCYDPAWNLARISVRGVEAAAERIRIDHEIVGLGIFVR